MKNLFKIILIQLLLIIAGQNNIFAQYLPPIPQRLSYGHFGTVVTIGNPEAEGSLSIPTASYAYSDVDVKNYLELGVDHDLTDYLGDAYDIEVDVDITPYNGTTPQATYTQTLSMGYHPFDGESYKDKAIYRFSGGDGFDFKIVGIRVITGTITTTVTDLPKNIYLDGTIIVERRGDFTTKSTTPLQLTTPKLLDLDCDPDAQPEVLQISWLTEPTAIEYQLEWTFVNNYKGTITSGQYDTLDAHKLDYDFRQNSTRITTKSTSYDIPLVFESGFILWRVRAIGLDPAGNRITGYWTHQQDRGIVAQNPYSSSSPLGFIDLNSIGWIMNQYPHEVNKNWQLTTTFAEEGKKKEVISYYDGSLRNRQSVTVVNTDKNVIVGETIYDHQGRPAINVLPVPVERPNCGTTTNGIAPQASIKYYPNFNTIDGIDEYSRNDFDLDAGPCESGLSGMDSLIGASNYYSGQNANLEAEQAFVPNAKGYPFTQVEYTPDNTGRIRKQSGVGPEFQLGSGHESNYYYGSPFQIKLDRLFASEVGYAAHYKKNLVVDPNGQVSVSYLDQEGRVVATALAGDAPTNLSRITSLEQLENNGVPHLTVDVFEEDINGVSSNNTVDVTGEAIVFSKEFLVSSAGEYIFDYDLESDVYKDNCTPDLCFNCVYDLKILLTDGCGNTVEQNINDQQSVLSYHDPILIEVDEGYFVPGTNGNGATFTTNCPTNDRYESPVYKFSADLEVGNYTLTKVLTVNNDALLYAFEEYIAEGEQLDCVQSFDDFLAEEMAMIDTSGCNMDCDACVASLGTAEDFVSAGLGTIADYEAAVEACQAPCNTPSYCETIVEMMKADMAPGGQYGQYLQNGNNSVLSFPLSVYNTQNLMPYNLEHNNTTVPNWMYPEVTIDGITYDYYLNDFGDSAKVYLTIINNAGTITVSPNVINPTLGAGGDIHHDPILNVYYTYPNRLADVYDFIDEFQYSWAQSLVKYHPEYCYYSTCLEYDIEDVNGESSESFDKLMRSANSFSSALQKGLIEGTAGNYYIPNYITSTVYDPFLTNSSFSPYNEELNNPNNTNDAFDTYKVINGHSYTMQGFAAILARGGNGILSGSTAILDAYASQFGDLPSSGVPDAINDKEWNTFKSLYLSKKRELQSEYEDAQALLGNCFNDCIGNEDFNPYTSGLWVPPTAFPYWNNNPYYDDDNTCSFYRRYLYLNKTKRFPDQDDMLGNQSLTNLSNSAAYQTYLQTGQCPNALNLQNLLSEIAGHGSLTITSQLENFVSYGLLYGSIFQYTNLPPLPSATWTVGQSSGDLEVEMIEAGSSSGCKLTLTPMTALSSWNNVVSFSGLTSMGYSGGLYTFSILANLNDGTHVEVEGSTCINLQDCEFAEVCQPNDLALGVEEIMSLLASENHFISSNYVFGSQSMYTNAINIQLQNLLGGSPINTYKWTFTGTNNVAKISDGTNELHLYFNTTDPSTFAGYGSIAYFDEIQSEHQHYFSIGGYDVLGDLLVKIDGEALYTNDGGVTYEPVSFGECDLPDPASCSQDEHHLREDLEALMNDALANQNYNIYQSTALTSLITSYLGTGNASNGSINSIVDNGINYQNLTINVTDMDNQVCTISLMLDASLGYSYSDIVSVNSLVGVAPINGNTFDHFEMEVVMDDGSGPQVVAMTGESCLPLLNCDKCTDLIPPVEPDSVAIYEGKGEFLKYTLYDDLLIAIADLNGRLGYSVGDSNYIEAPSIKYVIKNNQFVVLEAYIKFIENYDPAIDKSAYLYDINKFYAEYGPHTNVYEEYKRYVKAVAEYNVRASISGATTMVAITDTNYVDTKIADYNVIYIDYLKTEPAATGSAKDPGVYLVDQGIIVTPTVLTPCEILYNDYVDAHRYFFENTTLPADQMKICYEMHPLYSIEAIQKLNLCCSVTGMNAFQDYIDSFYNLNKCPDRLPKFEDCSDPKVDFSESCYKFYELYKEDIAKYNKSPFAQANLDVLIPITAADFLAGDYCNCVEGYLVYLEAYVELPANSTDPLPQNIDEYGPCNVEMDDCASKYDDYVNAIASYTQYVKDNQLNWPPIRTEVKLNQFIQEGLCYCTDAYVAYVNSLMDGYVDPGDINGKLLYIENQCKEAPCVPDNNVVLDTVSPFIIEFQDPCVEQALNVANLNAEINYNQYLNNLATTFVSNMKAHCLGVDEDMNMDYFDKEYHYTLYYYDQAGNLVKTVPPEGVEIVQTISSFDNLSLAINADRTNKTQSVFTSHRLATKYKYNSLNQLTHQSLPDHDQMDVIDLGLVDGLDPKLVVETVQFVNETKGYLSGHVKYNGHNRGLLYTTNDGGQTWQKVENLLGSDLQSVQWIDGIGTAYAVGTKGTLIQTTDGGFSWDMLDTYGQNVTSQLNDLVVDANLFGYAVGNNSTIIEINGITVTAVSPVVTTSGYQLDGNDHITSILYNGGSYYITVDYTSVNGDQFGLLFRSSDGVNWEALPSVKVGQLSKVQAIDANNYVAVGQHGTFLKSVDGGDNWFVQSVDSKADFIDVYFSNTTEGIAIRENGLLYATHDGGDTWGVLHPTLSFNEFYPYVQDQALAYGSNGALARVIMQTGTNFGLIELDAPINGSIKAAWAGIVNSLPKVIISDGANHVWITENASGSTPTWNMETTTSGSVRKLEGAGFGNSVRGIIQDASGGLYGYKLSNGTFTDAVVSTSSAYTALEKNNSTNEFVAYEPSTGDLVVIDASAGIPSGVSQLTTVGIHPINELSIDGTGTSYVMSGANGTVIKTVDNSGSFTTTDQTYHIRPQGWNDVTLMGDILTLAGDNGAISQFDVTNTANQSNVTITEDKEDYNSIASNGIEGIMVGDDGIGYKMNSTGVVSSLTTGTSEDLLSVAIDANSTNGYIGGVSGQLYRTDDYTVVSPAVLQINSTSDEAVNGIHVRNNGLVSYVGDNAHVYQGQLSMAYQIRSIYTPDLIDVHFSSVTNGYVAGNNYTLRHTADGGNNWTTILPSNGFVGGNVPLLTGVQTLNTLEAVVIGDNGYIANSNNSVATNYTTGVPAVTYSLNDIEFTNSNDGIIVGGDNTGKVWLTNDGGDTWAEIMTIPAGINGLNGVHGFANNTFMAVGDGESILFVEDANNVLDFTTTTGPPYEDLYDVYFYDDVNGYAVGTNGKILRSKDATFSGNGTLASIGWEDLPVVDNFSSANKDIYTIDFANRYQGILGGEYSTGSTTNYTRTLRDESGEFSTRFWYDRLGRIVVSQNSKQYNTGTDPKRYSYTLYDELGRVVEAGEKVENTTANNQQSNIFGTYVSGLYNPKVIDDGKLNNWISDITGQRQEVTHSYYDRTINHASINLGVTLAGFTQDESNLRKRISAVTYEKVFDGNNDTYNYGTFYDYDIHGNVRTLIQHNKDLAANPSTAPLQYKKMDYDYDLISGNVNEVAYQEGEADAWYHQYTYDGDNRIVNVETSEDRVTWDRDAHYIYYDHGPLARVELGEHNVQGVDYVYTLQGWLKGVNSDLLNPNNDVGQDAVASGSVNNPNEHFARDAYGFSLMYYENDYSPIDYANKWGQITNRFLSAFDPNGNGSDVLTARENLYNGNIGAMVTTITEPVLYASAGGIEPNILPQATAYRYDQLNRLVNAEAYQNIETDPSSTATIYNSWKLDNDYQSEYLNTFKYDASGNITHQDRYDHLGHHIEDLEYHYATTGSGSNAKIIQNRLYSVTEGDVTYNADYDDDIEDMGPFESDLTKINNGKYTANPADAGNNYRYDAIGQLIEDKSEGIYEIQWRVDGKISAIIREPGHEAKNIVFDYDPMGNRIAKHIYSNDNFPDNGAGSVTFDPANVSAANWEKTTFYNRDAQGNTMAMYEYAANSVTSSTNFSLTERYIYGSSRVGMKKDCKEMIAASTSSTEFDHTIGMKRYELNNHLGSVLEVVTDRKHPIDDNGDLVIDYYQPEIVKATDYSPFGVELYERRFERTEVLMIDADEQLVVQDEDDFSSYPTNAQAAGWTHVYGTGKVTAQDEYYIKGQNGGGPPFAYGVKILAIKDWSNQLVIGDEYEISFDVIDKRGSVSFYTANGSNGLGTSLGVSGAGTTFTVSFVATSTDGSFNLSALGLNIGNTYITIDNLQLKHKEVIQETCTATVGSYAHTFQGQEKDDEIKGSGNSLDFGARMYDCRLGRWLSIDPYSNEYKSYSVYTAMVNNPIINIDVEGERIYFVPGLGYNPSAENLPYISALSAELSSRGHYNKVIDGSNPNELPIIKNNVVRKLGENLPDMAFVVKYGSKPALKNDLDIRIVKAAQAIANDLLNNPPTPDDDQINLMGISQGSVTIAQSAILLLENPEAFGLDENFKIDNLILVGAPVDPDSELYKKLEQLQLDGKIGKIEYDDFQSKDTNGSYNDEATGAAGTNKLQSVVKGMKFMISAIKQKDKHPHVAASLNKPLKGGGSFAKEVVDTLEEKGIK